MDSQQQSELERIQRLLGRCMLRLQQYERLLKALWVDHEVAGPPAALQQIRTARSESLRKSPLGDVRKKLLGSFFRAENETFEEDGDAGTPPTSSDGVHFSLRTQHVMPKEAYEQFVQNTESLVLMRNDLVHHLLDRYDLSQTDARLRCIAHLERCLDLIGERHEELLGVCHAHIEAREAMAEWTKGEDFYNLMHHGISPDGSFDWRAAGIVGSLQEAAKTLSRGDGWTLLKDAIERIAVRNPNHVPDVYGCISWPHVLTQSRLFDLRYEVDDDGRKQGLYRPRRIQ